MPKYKVEAFTGLILPAATVVSLSEKQLAPRRHQVRDVEGGLHEALVPLSFKVGEVVDTRDPLPKVLAQLVEDLAAPQGELDTAEKKPRRGRVG